MSAWTSDFTEPPTINSVQVLDGTGKVLFDEDNAVISHDAYTRFDHTAAPLKAQVIVLRFESGNLGNLSDDIAIDSIVFSQTGQAAAFPSPIHRYSFSATSGVLVEDSVGNADGAVKGSGFSWGDGELTIDGGSPDSAAYVDLPNRLISNLNAVSFEAWITLNGSQRWSRVFDFGSTEGGEITEPGGGGEGLDYVMVSAQIQNNTDAQRIEIRNNDISGGGANGEGGPRDRQWTVDISPNTPVGQQFHTLLTWEDATGTLTQYHNGAKIATLATDVKLRNLNDVNNWLGRSNWSQDENLEGSYDEFRIYDQALTEQQAAASFESGPDSVGDSPAADCDPIRVTFDPGNERLPVWDPRGGLIAFTTDREPGDFPDIGGVSPDGSNERLLAKGPQSGFGLASGPVDWVGSSGQLIASETVGIHEYLAFDVTKAPFTRSKADGNDDAFTRKLLVDGGGGGGFLKVSRDGSTVLWRFSRSGGGGRTTIHTAPYSSLTGQSASGAGTIHVDVNTGVEQRFLQGAAIAPDGSFFILAEPAGEGHDLWLYTTDKSVDPIAITTSGQSSGASNRFPEISPDATKVAFTYASGKQGETNEIYLMNISGGIPTNLTNTPDLSEAWPTWAPDGKSIAYGRFDADGSPGLQPGETPNTNIYVLCADGSGTPGDGTPGNQNPGSSGEIFTDKRTLTYQRLTNFSQGSTVGAMAISADGSKIIYTSSRKEIFTLNADGTGLKEVFRYADFRGGCPCLTPFIDISADGKKIVWTDTSGEIFIANSDGSGRIRAATAFASPFGGDPWGPVIPVSPKLTADGSKAYFVLALPGPGQILHSRWIGISGVWRVNSDGSGLEQVFSYGDMATGGLGTDGSEYNSRDGITGLDISDDGSKIVIATNETGGAILTYDGTFRKIHSKPPKSGIVTISGDGSTVAYNEGFDSSTEVAYDNFAGGGRRVAAIMSLFETALLSLNGDGSTLIYDPSGTGGSLGATLISTRTGDRLDLGVVAQRFDGWQGSNYSMLAGNVNRVVLASPFGSSEQQIWIVDDFRTWRPAGVEIIVTTGAVSNGRVEIIVSQIEALRDTADACYIRTRVGRK